MALPLGPACAVRMVAGPLGAFLVGVLVRGEPASAGRVAAALLIFSGIAPMKAATPGWRLAARGGRGGAGSGL